MKFKDFIMKLSHKGLLNWMPDKPYLKLMFGLRSGRKIDLKNPKTFTEKMQWLKLYNRNPEYTKLVDKYEVKSIIADRIGDEYIVPTLGVWDKFDDIDFDSLPNQFVLKCTHDSGGLVVCKDKSQLDLEKAKQKIEKSLKTNYYWHGREWPYKNVKPRIIAEKYIADSNGVLVDYKFYCFNGEIDSILVAVDRHLGDVKFYFFSKEWKFLRINNRGLNTPEDFSLPKPEHLDEMIMLAEKLAKGYPFIRVDLYDCEDRVYFGELTFFPASGEPTIPIATNKAWGDKLILPPKRREK